MHIIQSPQLAIAIASKGAELQSIRSKVSGIEYLWQGDPAFWAKHSPVLFPVVGTLKNDEYYYGGHSYKLGRHGFARDRDFEIEEHTAGSVTFLLRSDAGSLAQFPFAFELRIHYTVIDSGLSVRYRVKNPSSGNLYFSIGGHPAFNVPLGNGLLYEDYFLEFNEEETTPRWPISADGLILDTPEPLLKQTNILPLSKELFLKDALVLKNPSSSIISLKTNKSPHGLDFDFSGFPFLGLWAAKNADFVCIEPWCGIADPVASDQQLIHKEGIQLLPAGGEFERDWNVRFY